LVLHTYVCYLTNYFTNQYFSNSCWSISYVFCQVPSSIKLQPEKKRRYSHLAVSWNKSQITICHVKIRTPPTTLWFKKILIGFLYFPETMITKLSVNVYLFLALYGSTTIQTWSFLKNIENYFWFSIIYLLGFFILEKQLAIIPDRGFLFLRNTLLFYSLSHYWRTESQTESQIHLLRMGWRNLFSSCAVVLVFCSSEK
jgi:hypothetical protein